jgi:hypothetical protein
MRTQSITIDVDPETARAFYNASRQEKDHVVKSVRDVLGRTKQERLLELFSLMDSVSDRAKELGLTEDELQVILSESK